MWIFLDLSVILIIIVSAFISAKRGFVRTAVETVGFIAAVIIAFTFSTTLAELTYSKVIEPRVVSAVCEKNADNTHNTADVIWEAAPDLLTENAEKFGFSKDKVIETVNSNASDSIREVAERTSRTVFKPIVVKLLSALYSLIMTVILLVVVKFAARVLNGLFSFSIVGKLNRMLGGIVGMVKGAVIAAIFCVAITLAVSFTANGFLIFTHGNIADSYIFGYISSLLI